MKVLFLFVGVVALALSASVNVKKPYSQQYTSETYDYAHMEKVILQLFKNVYQPDYYPELAQYGSTYSFETNSQFYTNPKYVFEFLEHYKHGFLPKGQIFSIFYDQHQKEAIAFFRVLYSAVDFDTFYKTAAWGRMHLNEGLYIYALSVALVHRPDTWQLELPPIYEMYPFYFYNAEVLQKAHQHFFKGDYTKYFKPTEHQTPYFYGKSQYPGHYYQKYESYPYYKGSESYQQSYPWNYYSYPYKYGQYPYGKSQFSGSYEKSYPYEYQHGKSFPSNYHSYPYSYGQFPYEKSQYPGGYEQYQQTKSYPYTYGQYPYYKSQYPGQYEQFQQEKSYPYVYGQNPYYKGQYTGEYEQYQQHKSYPWNYHSYPYTYGQYPYHKTQYPGEYEQYQHTKSYPYTYGQYPYYKSHYPGQYEQFQQEKSYPYVYGQNPYYKGQYPGEYEQYQQHKSYPWNYHSYPYTYGEYPYHKTQYPGEYEQYQHTKSYPYTYGQYPYYKSHYPGQYEKFQQEKSYPYFYGQNPYYKGQYPGEYEQYQQHKSYPWNYHSYPYTYGQYPYHKSQYPGQYEEYQYKQSEYYPKSHPMNYKSYPYKYGQYLYEKTEYPGHYEQYQHMYPSNYHSFPYTYGEYPYHQNGSFAKSFPWNYHSYPYSYGEHSYEHYQYPSEKYFPHGKFEKTFPYGKTEYPYGKTPFFYEKGQYPYGKTPYFYEKGQYPYGKMPFSHEKYEKFPTGKSQHTYPLNTEKYYPQERENVPEYYSKDNFEGIVIDYEYNTENPLFYFTEDVGMNAFYYYYHIYFPFWMTNEEIIYKTEFRGEQYYYFYQQLLARYNLELLSNGLSEIPLLDWDGFVNHGFETDLVYPNGFSFPQRPEHAPITPKWEVSMPYYDNATFSLTNIKNYEYRVLSAIDSGFVWTRDGKYVSIFEPQGFEVLGNLIQANPESPNARYYGSIQVFARYVLGYSKYPVDQYYIAPSVLGHFETSLRDPAFYQLYKRVIYYFQRYKQYLPKYTPDELYMDGVKIEDVSFDKLVTYFDYFYTDISSGLLGPMKDSEFKDTPILVKQHRLNHQPFNYYLKVNSEKPYEAVIRVFLGPKYDQYGKPYSINENRLNFVEFDRFTYTLVPGVNTIERNSRQSFFAPERTSYKELWMHVFNVKTPVYETTPKQVPWAMPQRMLLPKGTKEGQEFQMYFIITPYMGVPQGVFNKYSQNTPTLFWDKLWDKLPYGYPFDRPIEETYFFVPNSYFKDVVVYHEGFGEY